MMNELARLALQKGEFTLTVSFSRDCLVPTLNSHMIDFKDFSNFSTNYSDMDPPPADSSDDEVEITFEPEEGE